MGTVNIADNDSYNNRSVYDLIHPLQAAYEVKTCEMEISCSLLPTV
jgi:hypothetical protein